ncbi:DUF2442 domain-containing protein [Dyadobacter alkalitolerans]|uniref:DUF2442 domain-containing protein n=1 Tax=Dyadobacter alkalitolerans TaxID=492736 RepID=UPI00041087B2|nr:DUF2442 domain-containing protein [Dyadobacter alkalitolerans]
MEIEVKKVWFQNDKIHIETVEGEQRSHPVEWFPRLAKASEHERQNFELSPFGIHWPELDEDLSFEGFFRYSKEAV